MNFEFDNDRPIYIQLVEQLIMYIISGKLKPGERILSVRELALKTKVNPNTMQKALVELENLGLVYTERTNGKYVTNDDNLIKKYKEKIAKEQIEKFLLNMNELGFSKEEVIKCILNKKGDK